jgi:hypothetical protein
LRGVALNNEALSCALGVGAIRNEQSIRMSTAGMSNDGLWPGLSREYCVLFISKLCSAKIDIMGPTSFRMMGHILDTEPAFVASLSDFTFIGMIDEAVACFHLHCVLQSIDQLDKYQDCRDAMLDVSPKKQETNFFRRALLVVLKEEFPDRKPKYMSLPKLEQVTEKQPPYVYMEF